MKSPAQFLRLFYREADWRFRLRALLPILFAAFVFAYAVSEIKQRPRPRVSAEIQVALPLFVQVGMSGGDRYLAANLASIRALVTNTSRMQPIEYAIMAKLQDDASWLNPAHEDNYYIAAAILPWNRQLPAAQRILKRASLARPYDFQPSFLYAFNLLYFMGEPLAAAEWLQRSSEKLSDDDERLQMQNLAAKWVDRSRDLDTAINVVTALAKQAKRRDFQQYLERRVQRLRDLKMLRQQAALFHARTGRGLLNLGELVSSGLILNVPVDPFGFGFALNREGEIVLLNSEQAQ